MYRLDVVRQSGIFNGGFLRCCTARNDNLGAVFNLGILEQSLILEPAGQFGLSSVYRLSDFARPDDIAMASVQYECENGSTNKFRLDLATIAPALALH